MMALLAGALLAAPPSPAQTRMIQGGNAMDANPMVGSGGINFSAPRPMINRSNAIMTGNVGRGAAFQGFSPIRDPSQYYINLPSASLSTFDAQSMSVGALQQGISNYQPYLYYAPSRTMTDAGAVERRLNVPGTDMARTPYEYPRERLFQPVIRDPVTFEPYAARQPTGMGLAVEPALQRVFPYSSPAGQSMRFNERLLASPLFGRTYDVPLSQAQRWSTEAGAVPGGNNPALARAGGTPFEVQRPTGPGQTESSLARTLGNGPVDVTDQTNYGVDARLRAAQPPIAMGQELSMASAQEPQAAVPSALQVSAEPEWLGRDRFQDMAAAARSIREQLLGLGPGAAAGIAAPPAPTSEAPWIREYLAKPVTSFVGTSPTAVNDYLRRAEHDMRTGNYYRGASVYAMAASIDPSSPLPVLGQSLALIGAGEYISAASLLSKAVEKFPDIAYFRIDLKAFIQDPRVLQSRRADLERLLKTNEDYRLRFLLGYLEYYSGYTLPGLDDLARAAIKAPPGSPIARFPELLKQGKSIPPVPGAVERKLPAEQEQEKAKAK
jgi:hypothetical protein